MGNGAPGRRNRISHVLACRHAPRGFPWPVGGRGWTGWGVRRRWAGAEQEGSPWGGGLRVLGAPGAPGLDPIPFPGPREFARQGSAILGKVTQRVPRGAGMRPLVLEGSSPDTRGGGLPTCTTAGTGTVAVRGKSGHPAGATPAVTPARPRSGGSRSPRFHTPETKRRQPSGAGHGGAGLCDLPRAALPGLPPPEGVQAGPAVGRLLGRPPLVPGWVVWALERGLGGTMGAPCRRSWCFPCARGCDGAARPPQAAGIPLLIITNQQQRVGAALSLQT